MTAKLEDFSSDFVFLSELRLFLKEYVKETTGKDDVLFRKGQTLKLPDGRTIKICLPRGLNVFRDICLDGDLFFVGFIGFSKLMPEYIREKLWSIDVNLIEEFSLHEDILAYVSAERSGSDDWGNLVLLKSIDAIDKWRNCCVHWSAVELSPHIYKHVRIHRGQIKQGVYKTQRTLFLDFTTAPVQRSVKLWNDEFG